MTPPDHESDLACGILDIGDGNLISFETYGIPVGKPALVLHGGPGSGCTPWHRTLFDPAKYLVVLFDQRNCGRSTPHASEPDIDLSTNTTQNLVADIELLRIYLGIERWLVWGGSWGSTLALAYAEAHPDRVTEMILWGVTTGRRSEADRLFRGGVAPLFPERWARLRAGVPDVQDDVDIVDAYALADTPGILINGRFDLQAPLGNAWALHEAWPRSEVVVVEGAGHAADHEAIERELIRASGRFAER